MFLEAAADVSTEKQTILKIDFPTGFNKDNCICTAFGMKRDQEKNYTYGIGYSASNRAVTGSYYRHAVLGAADDSTKIALQVWQPGTEEVSVYYKLVLMKIDPDISSYELGDVNMDGEVKQADYDLVNAFLQGTGTLTDKQFKLADMNSDGKIDAMDTYLLIQKINGNS